MPESLVADLVHGFKNSIMWNAELGEEDLDVADGEPSEEVICIR